MRKIKMLWGKCLSKTRIVLDAGVGQKKQNNGLGCSCPAHFIKSESSLTETIAKQPMEHDAC
eukprot:TRINITY_DN1030_c0_g1_i2.p3 TRINITY_DN1030_c0_g1~~TRINITY_DN1030_c0_g1_i2.p3  ORF type:complete len:62 (+),score=4.58 TRINITY_DN1030_c0_g1_i2:86-271(+)